MKATEINFDEIVIKSDKPVMVDFWAPWCAPCRTISPVVDQLEKEFEGKAIIVKIDVDEHPNLAIRFGIRSIPSLLFFKDGQIVHRQVGGLPKEVMAQHLNSLIG